jgi:hypothetical protein
MTLCGWQRTRFTFLNVPDASHTLAVKHSVSGGLKYGFQGRAAAKPLRRQAGLSAEYRTYIDFVGAEQLRFASVVAPECAPHLTAAARRT